MISILILSVSVVICGVLALYATYLFAKTPPDKRSLTGQPSISFIQGISVVGIFVFAAWLSPIFNRYVLSLSPRWQIAIAVLSVIYILLILGFAKYAKNKT